MNGYDIFGIVWILSSVFSIVFINLNRDKEGEEADEAVFILSIFSIIPIVPLFLAMLSFLYFWDTKILGKKYERQTKLTEVREK